MDGSRPVAAKEAIVSDKKSFFSNHSKSSAAVVSLGIHAFLIVFALSFVAVTIIEKSDPDFKAKEFKRPRMQLKKLQVPVNIKKKKTQKPKLRKRIVVKPKLNRNMADIKMPEISGIKGGMVGGAGASLGGADSLGFSMPEFKIFGIKGKGEKVFLILDSSHEMMYDEMGGIRAYSIIKGELIRIIGELGATTLFNVAVFGSGNTYTLFPSMVPASVANAAKAKAWLEPLNAVVTGMGAKDFGPKTLGPGGNLYETDVKVGEFQKSDRIPGAWYRAAAFAMLHRADTVFLLSNRWGSMGYHPHGNTIDDSEWMKSSAGKKWQECYQKGLKMLDEENKRRAARGDPPKVLQRADWAINKEYFPGIEWPPKPEWRAFATEDFIAAFPKMRAMSKNAGTGRIPMKSGLSRRNKKTKDGFSFNVVQFVKAGETGNKREVEAFKKLTTKCDGDYKTLAGLAAIESHAQSAE